MKIKCPKCNGKAELADDFSFVRCDPCSLDITYGEYVKVIAYKDHTYTDILGDYTSTEGTKAGSLDDW